MFSVVVANLGVQCETLGVSENRGRLWTRLEQVTSRAQRGDGEFIKEVGEV